MLVYDPLFHNNDWAGCLVPVNPTACLCLTVVFHWCWSLLTWGTVCIADMTCLLVIVSLPNSLWAKYNGCVHYCGRCSLWVCEKKREGIFYFFVHPVKPIIINNWLRHTGVFAECICTIHRKHCRVHYIYLQQKFKGDPMWVFSSVFYCLWLSLGSL